MRCTPLFSLLLLCASGLTAFPQSSPESPYYTRRHTFGVATEYSNNSSRILLGKTEQRKLLGFDADYSRRLFTNRIVNWQYLAELSPILLESDPVTSTTLTIISPPPGGSDTFRGVTPRACHPASGTNSEIMNGITYSSSYVNTCSRRWTFGEGFSPAGSQFNFLPSHRIQPVFSFLGGYMFSTKPIPVQFAGSSNFTFEVGMGVEIYRDRNRSIRAEYSLHHISNAYTAVENPGIDNQLIKIVYSFGR